MGLAGFKSICMNYKPGFGGRVESGELRVEIYIVPTVVAY
jgi:hypothetical protein